MIKIEDIKVGDTFYVVLLDTPYRYVCTRLMTFEAKSHFMIEHGHGMTRNDICFKTEEESIKIVNNYRARHLKRLEKQIELAIKSVADFKEEMKKPVEIRSYD